MALVGSLVLTEVLAACGGGDRVPQADISGAQNGLTPTGTPTPEHGDSGQQIIDSANATATAIVNQAQATANEIFAATPQATVAESSPTVVATATLAPIPGSDVIYPGEHTFNQHQAGGASETTIWGNITQDLIGQYPRKAELNGANSLLTSLTNPFVDSDAPGRDPNQEPGLGHDDLDIGAYRSAYSIIMEAEYSFVSCFVRPNS